MAKRKPVFGVGANDADYVTNGRDGVCPYYRVWHNMLKRCYCEKYQKTQPTYIGCTVCKDWLKFSNFKAWMEGQDWSGKELDKDILKPGNKVYSPDACMFVTRQINSLLNPRKSKHPFIPTGVYFDLNANRWRAEFTADGKKRYIGVYPTWQAAGRAYKKAKAAHIRRVAKKQPQPLRAALIRHADALI